jgi:hypothetical protein
MKQQRELSESSDGEKEVAEISDEKLREDLEVGNVSVELLRRLRDDVVSGQVILPSSTTAPPTVATTTAPVPSVTSTEPRLITIQTPFEDLFLSSKQNAGQLELSPPYGNNLIVAVSTSAAMTTNTQLLSVASSVQNHESRFDKPFGEVLQVSNSCGSGNHDVKLVAGKGSAASSYASGRWEVDTKCSSSVSPVDDRYNEDSNRWNRSGDGAGDGDDSEKRSPKSTCDHVAIDESDSVVAASFSRKLILDKIETEKRHSQHRRSGSGGGAPQITSEEFDELYRLPTEHLRKDRQSHHGASAAAPTTSSAVGERCSRPSVITDRHSHHNRHRHHSHDSFHAAGGRHAYTDDDRAYRDVEGACGGSDYYDDMAMLRLSPTSDFDLDPPQITPTSVFMRSSDASMTAATFGALTLDDWLLTADVSVFGGRRHSHVIGARDASSSPESPASPHSAAAVTHVGARPKKSLKKHRAV